MDCNVLRIVLGNDFPTRMTIKAVGIDGSPIPDFSLENSTDIVVKYKSASGEYEIDEYTIEGNNLFINWSGLGLGGYGFEITGVYNNAAWRYAARLIFRIVADQASANIPAGTLVNGVYLLDGWLAFLANTSSGGVESVNGKTGIVILTPEDIGAYEKPSTGIPKSDLASAVQASLNKADTALQNIKTVNNQSLVGNGNVSVGTYNKPANGIPATDLDSSVQQTLQDVANIEGLIPSQASPSNQLADKNFVNNQVSTNTANFVGTYNSLAELQAVTGATNNDYGFVIEHDSLGNDYYDRYKYNGSQWMFEYKVESTPFTAEQWAAIQSGITSALVTKLSALPTNAELTTQLNGKQATLVSGTNIKTVNNTSLLGNGNLSVGTYSKPSSGIPSSDLASAVQTSLGKADTAVQPAAIANLESKMAIVAASGTTLTASVDNYYLFGSEVGTLAITLTTPSDTTHITKAVFMLTTGSSPAVTFAGASGINVIAQDGFSIEASTTYEINAIYNGVAWVVAAMKLSSTPINS